MKFIVLVEFEIEAESAKEADNNVISELEGKNLSYVFRSVDILDVERE